MLCVLHPSCDVMRDGARMTVRSSVRVWRCAVVPSPNMYPEKKDVITSKSARFSPCDECCAKTQGVLFTSDLFNTSPSRISWAKMKDVTESRNDVLKPASWGNQKFYSDSKSSFQESRIFLRKQVTYLHNYKTVVGGQTYISSQILPLNQTSWILSSGTETTVIRITGTTNYFKTKENKTHGSNSWFRMY